MREQITTNTSLLESSAENRKLLQEDDNCDKYDYLAAVACGVIGGLMDILLVGAPGDSTLGNWTDKQIDNAVMGFARKMGWNPKAKNSQNAKSAIGFLENKFRINYDQRKPSDVANQFNLAPSTHHMMSLAHSPDIVGVFFSILNQFFSTSTFITDGELVTIDTATHELRGGNYVMKIMCGIANWFGHLMSDIAGSSGSHNRGVGIVMPFYEFFGFCKFGNFSTQNGTKDLSELAMQAFTQGYDFRFGLAQAIPVVITELSIRLIWALRRFFQYHRPLKECLPTMKHSKLRVMILWGNGTLCLMDGLDAGIRSGGNALTFFMRLNLVAWFRFSFLVFKEICIRIGIADPLQKTIDAYKRINEVLTSYLQELEKIDTALFISETEKYEQISELFFSAKSNEEYNTMIKDIFDKMGYSLPWEGDFDEHMANKNGTLVFK